MQQVWKWTLLVVLVLGSSGAGVAQTRSVIISGKVTDAETEEPLYGAAVRLVGYGQGAVTQADGTFKIPGVRTGRDYIVEVSFVGYQAQEVSLAATELQDPIRVALAPRVMVQEEVIVRATRATENTPTAYTLISEEEIAEQNLGQDMPYLLNLEPSTVVSSDAGAGVGYTGLRIRGTDPTRINVTINGIPVNDAESQGVFWVNMPDLASSVESIQVQRGVGTSTNGSGAFGASINIQTSTLNAEPYATVDNSVGSFNTRKHTLRVGTGLLKNRWAFDARLSRIKSDGFIDRSFSDLSSWYISGGYHGDKTLIKAYAFSGSEQTYQAWYGVPEWELEAGNRTFNEAGTDYGARATPYENETDNYGQTYYQLIWTQELSSKWHLNNAMHLTQGAGYYEQYKVDDGLADYGIFPVVAGDTIGSSDIIRRLWLDNNFYGWTGSAQYLDKDRLEFTVGGSAYRYDGLHFGEVVWARFAGDSEIRDNYYQNDATKLDMSAYVRALFTPMPGFNLFADLQGRRVDYTFLGYNRQLQNVEQNDQLNFFNPKVGVSYVPAAGQKAYASFSIGSREPSRTDYVDTTPESRPLPETLRNLEAGYELSKSQWTAQANVYYMDYKNQLVLTGAVNDVGAFVRTNIPDSYRAGIELLGGWQSETNNPIRIEGNLTLSRNKIAEYTEYVPTYDPNYTRVDSLVVATSYTNTDIAFSPNIVAGGQASYLVKALDLNVALLGKYVGRQYLDNTQTEAKSLDPYGVLDLRIQYQRALKGWMKSISATLQVNNLLSAEYEANGYTFSENYLYDNGNGGFDQTGVTPYNYYYPQAGRNFLASVSLRF